MIDPIVEEIRSTRERIALESDCDIHAIAEAARETPTTVGRSDCFSAPTHGRA